MYKIILSLLLLLGLTLNATENNSTKAKKSDLNTSKQDITKNEVEAQIKREEKYAKEMIFYQGDNYDLAPSEVNQKSLDHIKALEPDYEFDMDDVYSDAP